MSLKLETSILGSVAIPEYINPAAYDKQPKIANVESLTDFYKSQFKPEKELLTNDHSSLKPRVQGFEGDTEENMLNVPRHDENKSAKIDQFVQSKL